MRARLIPINDGPPIELQKDLTLIGRNEDCDIRIEHKSISKIHCILAKTDGLILVRDLGSTNGTRVNGQRIRRAALLPNDQLAIAGFRYRVKLGDEPDEPEESEIDPGPAVEEMVDAADEPGEDEPPAPAMRRNVLPDEYPIPIRKP